LRPVPEILAELAARGVRLWRDGDKLAYDAPKGALTPATIAELKARKPDILAALAPAAATLPRRDPDRRPPLSFGQQRLWFLDQLEGPSGTYNMQTALHLSGPLDGAALQRALADIVARHEVLRTRLVEHDGAPIQVIDPPRELPLAHHALDHLPADAQAAAVRAAIRAEAARPIDLRADLMLRAALLRLGPDAHALVLTTHHIASDGWSLGILLRELSLAYAAHLRGEPPRLPDLPVQFADFAAWQRGWLAGPRLRQQLDFWRRYLDGAPPLLRLPTDFARPAQQTYRGDYVAATIPPELAARLASLARRADCTLFMVVLSAYMALLHRHSGQDDLLVGTHIAGRTRQEIEPLIGFFVNTLALRADLRGAPTFAGVLAQIRGAFDTAYEAQDVPYELLVEELRPQRNPSYSPLCQVTFAMQTALSAELDLAGLRAEVLRREAAPARFDLTLGVSESRGALECMWRYNTDLFEARTIEALAAQFARLLQAVCDAPDAPLATLPLDPTPPSLHAPAPAPPSPFVARLAEHAAARPDALALAGDDDDGALRFTYRELHARVLALAAALRARGVGPEVRVAVALDRSPWFVVAALAVWAAGGVHVPIDPDLPAERQRRILADAGPAVLLRAGPAPAALADLPALDVRAPVPTDISSVPADIPDVPPDALAYIMFTSGSTGQPKGVAVTRANLDRYAGAIADAVDLRPDDVVLHTAAIGFSSAIRQIVAPLARGAALVVATAEQRRDPALLLDLVRARGVTVLDLVPSHWRSLVEARARGDLAPLPVRLVLSASEPLPPDLVRAWWTDAAAPTAVCNMYGQTETTGIVSVLRLAPGAAIPGGTSVRLGRPIAGVSLHVLDERGAPTPLGVAGELYVGGDTLARGYLDDAQTAERFLHDPFTDRPDARLYRTGDLARVCADGSLEFVQRGDLQVKIRGHRVEPAEVEHALLRLPDVAEAAVAAQQHDGETRLVAYAVPRDAARDAAARPWPELLEPLRRALPTYMVPAAVLRVARLPRTASGKLDRAALRALDVAAGRGHVAPRDALEHRLAAIWRDVLGLTHVGVDASFFDLGGHSLLAVRLLARIHHDLGRRLPLTALFANQTIAALAAVLRGEPTAASDDCLVELQPRGARPPLFFIPGGGGSALYLHHLARHLDREQPLLGLQPRGLDGTTPPLTTVEDTAALFLERIRQVQPRGPYHLAGHSFGGKVALELAQRLVRAGERVGLLAILDTGPWRDGEWGTGDRVRDMTDYLDAMAEFTGGRSATTYDQLAALDDEGRLRAIKAELERLGFLPPRTDMGEVRGLLNVLFASSAAAAAYHPTDLRPVPVALFSAAAHTDAEHARQAERWRAVGPVELHVVPGTHASMVAEPHVAVLADRLSAQLARAHQGEEPR
jgi:amino acid adenylation domain-containing protein